jgi:hypothetical protein
VVKLLQGIETGQSDEGGGCIITGERGRQVEIRTSRLYRSYCCVEEFENRSHTESPVSGAMIPALLGYEL